MRKRCDTDADAFVEAFADAQCRAGGGRFDGVYSLAFRYTDADALGDSATCSCAVGINDGPRCTAINDGPRCTAINDGAGCTTTNDGARRTAPGCVVLSAHQFGKVLRAR